MRVIRADNGFEVSLDELMRTGERPYVWSIDERKRLVARRVNGHFAANTREIVQLRLASGRQLEVAAGYSFLCLDGWIPLTELNVGSRLAALRRLPEPTQPRSMHDSEVIMLAHMIGDGSCVKRQPVRYASVDEANLAAVTIAAAHFGVTPIRDEYAAARVTTLRLPAPYRLARGKRNPIAEWLDLLGLFGLRSYEKFVPAEIFALQNDQVALFLRHLWATDGSVRWDAKTAQGRVYYSSTSRRLIDDVMHLLLRWASRAGSQRRRRLAIATAGFSR
jgi:replicative DNA helicase